MKEVTIITDDFICCDKSDGYRIVPRGSIVQIFNIAKYLNAIHEVTFRVYQMSNTDFSCLFEDISINAIKANSFDEYKNRLKSVVNSNIIHFNNIDLFLTPYEISHMTATIHTNAFLEKESANNWLRKHVSDFKKIIVVNKAYLDEFKYSNIEIINNGIDTSLFRYNIKVYEDPVILFFPNIPEPKKNVQFAIKLVKHLNMLSQKRFVLYVPGDNVFGINDDNIVFIDKINHGVDMLREYQKAFITLVPSISESCSLCMLESMASGTVVLANNIRGLSDYIVNGKTGFLLSVENLDDWSNIIFELLDNIDLYHHIAEAARRYVENKYTIYSMAENYYQIWKEWM